MPRSRLRLLIGLVAVLVVGAAAQVRAQSTPLFAVGQHVEVKTVFTDGRWLKGTVTQVNDGRSGGGNLKYAIHLDAPSPDSGTTDVDAFEFEVRAIAAFTPLKAGTVVDVFYAPGVARGRGVVRSLGADGRYRIHFAGCTKTFDDDVDHTLVEPARRLSRSSAAARFLFGKWVMFTPSYPNTIVLNGQVLREYGTGARTPPLVIKANGRYTWYFNFGKKPVRGRWTTDARIPGSDTGIYTVDGLLIKDPQGHPWKVYKRVVTGDSRPHITAQRVCSGITDIGTKAG